MGIKRRRRIRRCMGVFALSCILSGCSLSFCGLTSGRHEELTFTCEEASVSEKCETEVFVPEVSVIQTDQPPQVGQRVDLNAAGKEELMTLSGIGESRAEAILAYRQEYGAFTSIEDIMQVPGIKEGIFSKIKDQITVH